MVVISFCRSQVCIGFPDLWACSGFTVPSYSEKEAHQSGVRPSLSGILVLISCCRSSSCTTPLWPPAAAHERGVRPRLSVILGLTFCTPNSSSTTPLCPYLAALARGVLPHLPGVLGVMSARSSSSQAFQWAEIFEPGLVRWARLTPVNTKFCT